jgi:8-oxo-dGTP pyrophosphatase MutT (NUDIX family)
MPMSEYVRRLREKVGNDFLLMPAVAGILRDDRGRVLLVQHVVGRWQFPGGAIDPGERPLEALVRECREEADIEVRPGRILGAFGGPEYRTSYENGDEVGYVTVVYEIELVDGTPRADGDETQAVGWFSPDELDGLDVHPAVRMTLRAVVG